MRISSKLSNFQSLLDSTFSTQSSHASNASHFQPAPHLAFRSPIKNLTTYELFELLNISTQQKSEDISSLSAAPIPALVIPITRSSKLPPSSCITPVLSPRVNITVSNRIQSQENSPDWETPRNVMDMSYRLLCGLLCGLLCVTDFPSLVHIAILV